MKTMNCLVAVAAAFAVVMNHPAIAAFKDAKLAFKSGNWSVYRSIDSMKDTVNCTGVYKENYGIQLTDDTLFITVKGGLESVTLRFGDKSAHDLRLATEMEKKVGSIIISGADFAELLDSNRLRVQASTLIRGLANEDLDLSGLSQAVSNIKAECPIQASAGGERKAEKAAVCSDVLLSRMRSQGLKESQILAICHE